MFGTPSAAILESKFNIHETKSIADYYFGNLSIMSISRVLILFDLAYPKETIKIQTNQSNVPNERLFTLVDGGP